MRQSEKNNSVLDTDTTKRLQLIEKINSKTTELVILFDFEHVERQLTEVTYSWVCSDLIEVMKKPKRESTIYFIMELKRLLITIFNENKKLSNLDYLQLYDDFVDRWSYKNCKDVIDGLSEAFINSEFADDPVIRSNVYMFLVEIKEFLGSIYKSLAKYKAISN